MSMYHRYGYSLFFLLPFCRSCRFWHIPRHLHYPPLHMICVDFLTIFCNLSPCSHLDPSTWYASIKWKRNHLLFIIWNNTFSFTEILQNTVKKKNFCEEKLFRDSLNPFWRLLYSCFLQLLFGRHVIPIEMVQTG